MIVSILYDSTDSLFYCMMLRLLKGTYCILFSTSNTCFPQVKHATTIICRIAQSMNHNENMPT